MNFFKKLFHKHEYNWSWGYGFTKNGVGSYEFQYCKTCFKITGRIKNFISDKNQ